MQPKIMEDILKKVALFNGLNNEEIKLALTCFKYQIKHYSKGTIIFNEGDQVESLGIILEGEVTSIKNDFNGNSNIIATFYPSDLLAAIVAYAQALLPFDIIATADSVVLFINKSVIINHCSKSCQFHNTITYNMLQVVANKNLQLINKISLLTKRSTREKILSYLHDYAKKVKKKHFSIPLNRKQLAEYLSVDRSALSRELSKMAKDGLIYYQDHYFILL